MEEAYLLMDRRRPTLQADDWLVKNRAAGDLGLGLRRDLLAT